mgnify:CR=1 FL=1
MSKFREEIQRALEEGEERDKEDNQLYGDRRADELPNEIRKKEVRPNKLEGNYKEKRKRSSILRKRMPIS